MKKGKDNLGDRMKYYEDVSRTFLPSKTYTVIRIDGKAFHTYTKGLPRPFDWDLVNDMDETAKFLCKHIQGAKCAFVQSDEISLVLTDFDKENTSSWLKGNTQKQTSISASLATAKFNELRPGKLAFFDSRTFTIPSELEQEIVNYMIWRQQDTIRNSISSVGQSEFSPKELHGKNTKVVKEMLESQREIDWDDFDDKLKFGRMIVKEYYQKGEATRSRWISQAAPVFTEDREYVTNLIQPNE